MSERVLQKSIYLRAAPEQVWAYLTKPEKLATWFHKPSGDLVAGAYEMFGTTSGDLLMWGEVLVAKPFSQLEYTFTIKPMGDATSTVKWTLEEVTGGTRLQLMHEGLPDGAEAFDLVLALDKGWDGHLGQLRDEVHAT